MIICKGGVFIYIFKMQSPGRGGTAYWPIFLACMCGLGFKIDGIRERNIAKKKDLGMEYSQKWIRDWGSQ